MTLKQFSQWRGRVVLLAIFCIGGCVHHPIDCAVGFYHADCLPGTAGYEDTNDFAAVDDKQCRSYGLAFGTPEYANCRLQLAGMRRGVEPNVGVGVVVTPGHK